MTQLFKPKSNSPTPLSTNVCSEENVSISSADDAIIPLSDTEKLTEKSPNAQINDDSEDLGNLTVSGNETAAVDGILSLGDSEKNLKMKSILPNPSGFTAAQVMATYNDSLGFTLVGNMLREVCQEHYQHLCGKNGKRAEQMFAALTQEVAKDYQLKKEAAGLIGK